MVNYIIFTVTLRDDAQLNSFLCAFKQLRRHCQENEPGTVLYELLSDPTNPRRLTVVERYLNPSDMDRHTASAAYRAFVAHFETLQVESSSLQHLHGDDTAARLRELPETDYLRVSTNSTPTDPNSITTLRKGVLVFAGSRPGTRASYAASATRLGERLALAPNPVPLIYGGGTDGLMGSVARAVRQHGGEVIAVLPRPLIPREAVGAEVAHVVYTTETMSERKSVMFALADAVVALPGGLGTFDELFEALTLLQLNAYRPKIGIVNTDGFYDPFLQNIQHLVQEGFVEEKALDYFVVGSVDEVMDALETFTPPETAPLKWDSRP